MKINPTCLEILMLFIMVLAIHSWTKYGKQVKKWWKGHSRRPPRPRKLKPGSPEACPRCTGPFHRLPRRPRTDVVPWSERKSQAGRPRTVDTRGKACRRKGCEYYGITDPAVHALVGDGVRGKNQDIPYLRCQACGKRISSRVDTMMYGLKTPRDRVAMVMTALTEGLSIAAGVRVFKHHHTTIRRWIDRAGRHSARLHYRMFVRALVCGHIQLDELVTRVKHQAEKVWMWTAIDAKTKLMMAVHIGGRATADASLLIHQIAQYLAPGCFPIYTSDGLNQYYYALTAHFGFWHRPPRARKYHWFADRRLQYAQMRKVIQWRKLHYLYSIVRAGSREVIENTLQSLGFSGLVHTSSIERSNLTLRELAAPLSRRTWSLAYDIYHLWLHVMWSLLYYNFIRPHRSLLIAGSGRRRYATPAMAAGLTRRPWSVEEVLLMPVPEGGWLVPFPAG